MTTLDEPLTLAVSINPPTDEQELAMARGRLRAAKEAVAESREHLRRLVREQSKRARRTQIEQEDEVLERWEEGRQVNPRPRQKDIAAEMGFTYSTFRTYLAHARRRRVGP